MEVTPPETSAALSAGLTHTPRRGWAVILLFRLQGSSIILISFTFGIFLPFISKDLHLSPSEAGLLQGIWWIPTALLGLPITTWFSRFRPVPLVLASLLLGMPFVFLQGLAINFLTLFLARFLFALAHVITIPARTLLLQQWVAPRQYALVNSVGLFQHSILQAAALGTSALLIAALGSWRLAYFIHGAFLALQALTFLVVAQERRAPLPRVERALRAQQRTPLRAILTYPQAWLLGITMFGLGATWAAMVTFLPTLLLEDRGVSLTLGGPMVSVLYFGLIPSALMGGFLSQKVHNRKLLLWVPALFNTLLGVGITLTPYPWLLTILIAGLGVVWMATPVVQVLPFEFPGIRPREVAVISSLIGTFSGIGFATGPVVTGLVTQLTGSLLTGLLVLCLLTSVGIIAGLLYPRSRAHAKAQQMSGSEP